MKKFYLLLVVCALFANMSAQTKKAGFLNVAASVSAIADDDEKAAAQWFTTTYGGDYIPVSQIGTIDLSQYSVIWIYADNESGYADAPDAIYAVAETINDYYKAGGNLLLSIYANNLLYEFGRTDMWPNIVGGAGPGGANPDVWQLSPTYGTWDPTKTVFDRSTDPLFAGLTTESVTRGNGNNYVIFPLIGNGWKEDHNCFWTMDIKDAPIANDNVLKLTTWESTHNVTALGSWGQVQDYFGAAIARWNPTTTYKGTCITIGVGAYEWNIKNGTNPYQANIERLTKNALDELKAGQTSLKNITDLGIKIRVSNNILTVENADQINKISLYSISGENIKTFDAISISHGINISSLSKGVYIIKMVDKAGKSIGAQRFVK